MANLWRIAISSQVAWAAYANNIDQQQLLSDELVSILWVG